MGHSGQLEQRQADIPGLEVHAADVLQQPQLTLQADIVFSVGLIEHLDPPETARHRSALCLRAASCLMLISFPTPTWLYRITRWSAERLGVRAFPDDRPLRFDEVRAVMSRHGELLARDLIWPIVLTQGMLVYRKAA